MLPISPCKPVLPRGHTEGQVWEQKTEPWAEQCLAEVISRAVGEVVRHEGRKGGIRKITFLVICEGLTTHRNDIAVLLCEQGGAQNFGSLDTVVNVASTGPQAGVTSGRTSTT